MKKRGIFIAALGIGSVDPVELWRYATSPDDTLIVEDFSQLNAKVVETTELLCPSKLRIHDMN